MTSSAIGTGMKTEIRLTATSFNGVTSDNRNSHGTSVNTVADTTLASSMMVRVGFKSIQPCLPESHANSLNTWANSSRQLAGPGSLTAQDSPSSPTVKGCRGLSRSSQRISDGTTTRMTSSRIPYLVRLIDRGNAMKVVMATTG